VDEPRRADRCRARGREQRGHDAERDRRQREKEEHAAAVAVEAGRAQASFDPRQRRADQPHGVPGVDRIAENKIGDDARRQQGRIGRQESKEQT
jgi:hypothetical protein